MPTRATASSANVRTAAALLSAVGSPRVRLRHDGRLTGAPRPLYRRMSAVGSSASAITARLPWPLAKLHVEEIQVEPETLRVEKDFRR